MKFHGKFRGIEFSVAEYISKLESYMHRQLEEGAREWLEATTGRVPLWSGMARASLLSISRLVNGRVVLSPLKGKSRVPKGESLGSAKIESNFPIFRFSVSSRVEHYVIQESRNVGKSRRAPWRSFEAGRSAFELFARSINLPAIDFTGKVIKRI